MSRGQRKGSPRPLELGFPDRSRYFSIQVAPQLSSRGWVDPVPDPLIFRRSGSAGNRTRDLWICLNFLKTTEDILALNYFLVLTRRSQGNNGLSARIITVKIRTRNDAIWWHAWCLEDSFHILVARHTLSLPRPWAQAEESDALPTKSGWLITYKFASRKCCLGNSPCEELFNNCD
jgi:hypothetical protein